MRVILKRKRKHTLCIADRDIKGNNNHLIVELISIMTKDALTSVLQNTIDEVALFKISGKGLFHFP